MCEGRLPISPEYYDATLKWLINKEGLSKEQLVTFFDFDIKAFLGSERWDRLWL